ncbi:MAG: hypothetical protein R3B09_32320 [Nannocystaceae bacterium]
MSKDKEVTQRLKTRMLKDEAEEAVMLGSFAVRLSQAVQAAGSMTRRYADPSIPKVGGYRVDRGVAAVASLGVNLGFENPLILATAGAFLSGWATS